MSSLSELRLPERIEFGDYSSFTDESDLTARYLVIGGVTMATSFINELDTILAKFQSEMPFGERLEWKAITAKNLDIFKRLVDCFCELNSEKIVDFHALVIDTHAYDHKAHNDGDKEITFDKMLFTSFYAIHQRYDWCRRIRCFHGNRDSRYPIENLKTMLNYKAFAIEGTRIYMPYAQVQHVTVKEQLISQLGDLLIGCVGAKWNKRKGYKLGSPKDQIACHFEAESPARLLAERTPYNHKHFDIWPLKFKDGLRA